MTGDGVPSRELATPQKPSTAWLAPGARLIGAVTLSDQTSIWYGAILRAEDAPIRVGRLTNIQDNSVVHTDSERPAVIGDMVSVGHGAILHGCEIGDGCLIGMGAIVMNGAKIGEGSLVAAGAVILEGSVIPPRSLVAGAPGKVKRQLTDEEAVRAAQNAHHYVELSRTNRRTEGRVMCGCAS